MAIKQKDFIFSSDAQAGGFSQWAKTCLEENVNKAVYFKAMTEEAYKTDRQNSLFHGLLTCFWLSGCSSFVSYDDMRRHYKRIAGLVQVKIGNSLKEYTKKCLFEAIKILPIEDGEKRKIVLLLKGQVEQELSWSEVSKTNATLTLDILLKDMDQAGVISSSQDNKYAEILKGLDRGQHQQLAA